MSSIILDKKQYELFEIHTLPRGLYCITVKLLKGITTSYYDGIYRWRVNLAKGSIGLSITKTENLPENCSFFPITTDFRKIHKRVDAIKDALNHTNLHLFIEDEEVQPYKIGERHKTRGIYLGMEEDDKGKYHKFNNNNITFKD